MANSIESTQTKAAGHSRFDTMSVLSLAAIAIVVVLISVPSLEHFAKRQNERDALLVLRILGRAHTTELRHESARESSAAEALAMRAESRSAEQSRPIEAGFTEQKPFASDPTYTPGDLGTLLQLRPEILHRLPDMEALGDGRELRSHGYLFRWLGNSPSQDQLQGSNFVVLAWPWEWGRTGAAAFALDGAGRQFRHENESQRWSGLDATPQPPPADGWEPLN